jgi:predicted TIM-barrel enzyme
MRLLRRSWNYGKNIKKKKGFVENPVIKSLQPARDSGNPIILAGVGSGLTAKGAVRGGADLLAVYNTAVYRIRGLPTALAFLPYDDANQLTISTAPEVIANAGDIPVLLGFGAHDPRMPVNKLVDIAKSLDAAGVTNEPFLGLYGKELRVQIEKAGLGFNRELALINHAVERDLLALGWVFSVQEAIAMAKAGAQIVGAMAGGITAGGAAGGVQTSSLDQAVNQIGSIVEAVKGVRKEILILGHGGPLTDPESVAQALRLTGADGYATGSSGERIPVEIGVSETIHQFKSIDITSED